MHILHTYNPIGYTVIKLVNQLQPDKKMSKWIDSLTPEQRKRYEASKGNISSMGGFHQRVANAYREYGLDDKAKEVKAFAKKHGHEIK